MLGWPLPHRCSCYREAPDTSSPASSPSLLLVRNIPGSSHPLAQASIRKCLARAGPGRGGGFPSSQTVFHPSCQASQTLRRGVCKTPRRCSKNMDCDQRPILPLHIQFIWRPLTRPRREGVRSLHASRISARGPGENRGAWVSALLWTQATTSPEEEAAWPARVPLLRRQSPAPPTPRPEAGSPAPLVLLKHFYRRLSAGT